MPPSFLQILAAVALFVVAIGRAHADESSAVGEGTGAPAGDGASSDSTLGSSWWLPGARAGRRAGDKLEQYLDPDSRPAESHQWSLIEQAERLLETPRTKGRTTGRSVTDVDTPTLTDEAPVRNMFSRTWSDGAPLLLFDWSGKSTSLDVMPGLKLDGVKRVAQANTATDWADVSSKVKLRERDAHLDPTVPNAWETDESVKVPVGDSLFVFGQLGASTPAVEQRQYRWLGRTGFGMKLKPWLLREVQVRGGPAVRYDDTEKLSPGQSPERSELFLEAATKVPLPILGPVNVEYSGYAVPAVTPTDRNCVNQDVKLALPFSGGGQFHVGAKYKWETASVTPWMDRTEVYMGVQSKW
jgi:hypothetical protein